MRRCDVESFAASFRTMVWVATVGDTAKQQLCLREDIEKDVRPGQLDEDARSKGETPRGDPAGRP